MSEKTLLAFDSPAALERVEGDRELLLELVGLFREQVSPLAQQIGDAAASRNGPALERSAHSLKGAAANLSALEVQNLALRLETLGREPDWTEAPAASNALNEALVRLNEALTIFEDEPVTDRPKERQG